MSTALPSFQRAMGHALETLYAEYNRPQFVNPDPLAPVLRYADPADQEVAGLAAASLAFGNVKQILRSVDRVLDILPRPAANLCAVRPGTLRKRLAGFRHRYTSETEMAALLLGMRRVLKRHGSLGACFATHTHAGDTDILPALERFTGELRALAPEKNYLLPEPSRGSACKRLMMYLRWMLRKDAVDPGCWCAIAPEKLHAGMLIVPIDTHMHCIARRLGMTQRNAADLRTALEVTEAFRRIRPGDPVRYDFALTRLGIRSDTDFETFAATWPIRPAGG